MNTVQGLVVEQYLEKGSAAEWLGGQGLLLGCNAAEQLEAEQWHEGIQYCATL